MIYQIIIFVLVINLILSWVMLFHVTKTDGRLIVDEAADSWTVSITTNPEEIKHKKSINLTVDIKRAQL